MLKQQHIRRGYLCRTTTKTKKNSPTNEKTIGILRGLSTQTLILHAGSHCRFTRLTTKDHRSLARTNLHNEGTQAVLTRGYLCLTTTKSQSQNLQENKYQLRNGEHSIRRSALLADNLCRFTRLTTKVNREIVGTTRQSTER